MRADRNAEYLAHVKHLELPDDADLATTISHGLTTATYECMVCCDVIKPFQATWGCDSCWAVFHLRCVQKWARRSIAETSLQSDGNAGSSGTEWTCPSCRAGHDVLPESYKCFCGRSDDPETRKFITPHSCGESCSRPRIQDHCVHSCSLPCHPGPCPPCPAMISTSCHCGRVETKSRCSSYNPTEGMSCGEVCGELLGCGKHYCQDTCHSGLCKPCGEAESKSCECGKVERTVACGTRKLNCDKVCNALYSCGVHECKQSCHNSNDGSHKTCPQSPALISSCPCGKQSIDLLCRIPRISCSDPIPTCGATCDKILICGHKCSKRCHSGDCPPCDKRIDVKCRCGLTSANRKCDEQMARITAGDGSDVVTCQHKCNALRVCGRHECGETCCPSYKPPRRGKAALVASTPDDDGGAHMCLLICGKPLKCGKHNCMALCHRGPCDPCLEASFDEYHCPCGKTIVYPPIRCGTPPPKCPHTCTRTRTCGHVDPHPHECHSDDVACPPCPVLGQRPCMCGKTSVRNVACHRPTPSCGTVCGKPLSCGGHFCKRLCHSGECLDSATTAWGGKGSAVTLGRCNQICGKPRRSCSHPCDETCHVPASCSETAPCAFKVDLSCPCGRLTAKRNCGATATSKPRQQIDCTQACLVAERNKRLAQALSVREDTAAVSTSASVGSQIALYEPELIEFARSYIPWILGIERQFADHLADPIRKALYLQPMDRLRRQMVHMLAAHYNMTSESVDPEPHRSVIVRKQLSPTPSQIPPNLLSKSLFMTTALTGKPQSSPASAMARVSVAANPFELPISKVDTSELPDNWEEASSDDEDDK
ncbi:hypothetical protein GQ42DRAFT_119021 [Ramicandelaber brevisporus]|nr:hypothetical protein GQ42DRAFT_119021 [Ramicandelaber brevisporus]